MRPNEQFIQLLQPKYQNGPPHNPIYWADPSMGVGFDVDKTNNFVPYTTYYGFTPTYQSGTNSLYLGGFNNNATVARTSGSYNISIFFVCRGSIPDLLYTYDSNWSDTGPGGGGSYNFGNVRIYSSGKVASGWNYTGTYPSESPTHSSVKASSTATYSIYAITANMDSSPTVTCRVNGVAQGSTTSVSPISIPVNPTPYNTLFQYTISGSNTLGDVIIYDSILSAGNITDVENYLRAKWGL